MHIQSNTSHILQELNKIRSLIQTVICAHCTFASVIFFFLRVILKGFCITAAFGMKILAIQEHFASKGKKNLYWKLVSVYTVTVTLVPLPPIYQERG